jgi:general stress protein 26
MKTNETSPERAVEDLISAGTITMVMTMVDGRHSSRPVTCVEADGGNLSFLVDRTSDWVRDIELSRATVHVTVADERHNTYLALNGTATLLADAAERKRLWTAVAGAWFDGPNDPTLGVMRFDVSDGEYWDGPSGVIGMTLSLVRAVVTKDEAVLGEHGAVSTH